MGDKIRAGDKRTPLSSARFSSSSRPPRREIYRLPPFAASGELSAKLGHLERVVSAMRDAELQACKLRRAIRPAPADEFSRDCGKQEFHDKAARRP